MIKKISSYRLILMAIFIAFSIIVGLYEIPFGFLKLDLSEVVILTSLYLLGFFNTLYIIILRSVIRYLLTGGTDIPFPFFGELIAIIASFLLCLISVIFLKLLRKILKDYKKSTTYDFIMYYILFATIMTVLISIILTLLNIFIIYPAFVSHGKYYFLKYSLINEKFKGDSIRYLKTVIGIITPFNIVKYSINYYFFSFILRRLDIEKIKNRL